MDDQGDTVEIMITRAPSAHQVPNPNSAFMVALNLDGKWCSGVVLKFGSEKESSLICVKPF